MGLRPVLTKPTTAILQSYDEKFPITLEGRIRTVGLIRAGVGLFATFTGCIASLLPNEDQLRESDVELLRIELAEIKQLLKAMQPPTTVIPPEGSLRLKRLSYHFHMFLV